MHSKAAASGAGHASPRENDASSRLICGHFFPKPRCARSAGHSIFMQRLSLSTPAGQHWRTLGRQPRIVFSNGVYTLAIDYARRKGEKSSMWKRVYSADEWKPGGWATEAAALAARSQFKHWVDHGMHLQQRLAQADSAAARSPASLGALQRPPDPTRVSGRKQPRNAHAIASLHVIDGKVQLGLAVAERMPDSSPGPDELIQYHSRSAGAMASQTHSQMWSDSSKSIRAIGVQRSLTRSSAMLRIRYTQKSCVLVCNIAFTFNSTINRIKPKKLLALRAARGVVNKGQFLRSYLIKKLITIVRISKF